MKIRTDFVSNSSSSSFIVIKNTNFKNIRELYKNSFIGETITLPNPKLGNTEFGWEFEKYSDFWSKLNFCALIVSDMEYYFNKPQEKIDEMVCDSYRKRIIFIRENYESYRDMLIDVCKTEFGLDVKILSHNTIQDVMFAYIDHQSSILEDEDNGRIFDNKQSLINFLASQDSYIKTGNDNTDNDEWYQQ